MAMDVVQNTEDTRKAGLGAPVAAIKLKQLLKTNAVKHHPNQHKSNE